MKRQSSLQRKMVYCPTVCVPYSGLTSFPFVGLLFMEASAKTYVYPVSLYLHVWWVKVSPCLSFRGDNVEDVFIETAKKIYQNIQDGK